MKHQQKPETSISAVTTAKPVLPAELLQPQGAPPSTLRPRNRQFGEKSSPRMVEEVTECHGCGEDTYISSLLITLNFPFSFSE